jgi:putative restriction endonuclease
MAIRFDTLEVGRAHDRPFLAVLWGYQSHHAFSRGVFTPRDVNVLVLFVTKEKQNSQTQYNDFIDGKYLFWEGEEKHASDQRIVGARAAGTPIQLFYRDVHHTPFVYLGEISLVDCVERIDKPSEFLFSLQALDFYTTISVNDQAEMPIFNHSMLEATEKMILGKGRLGQARFRKDVIRLWGSCAVTGFQNITVLKASHIKPWNSSSDDEKLDPFNGLLLLPNFDTLFDLGLISFEDNGKMLVSRQITQSERQVLNVREDVRLRHVFAQNSVYLEHHRDQLFLG